MTTTAPRTTATGRLGNGELRRQVAAWLDENPGPHTPGTIAKALGRSAGAVGNALKTLADRGEAELAIRQARPLPGHPRHQGGGRRHAPPPRRPSPPPPPKPAPAPSTRPAGRLPSPAPLGA